MKKLLLKTMLLLFALVAGTSMSWADSETITFSELGLTNGQQYTDPFGTNISVTFGGGGNDGKYYDSGTGIRTYGGGTITITAKGNTITNIATTFSGDSYAPADASIWSTETGTTGASASWSGSATKVVMTRPSGSGHWRLQSITVTYTTGGTPTCANPTFTPGTGVYSSTQSVTLSCETDGATIYYTTNGTDPTTSSSTYSSAISVSSTTTIKAMATATGYNNSSIASATYTFVEHAGTEADPYSVADAIAVTPASGTSANVYIHGKVSKFYNTSVVGDGTNYRYYISDDGTETDQLLVYRGKGLDNVAFSSADDLKIGDEVVIIGGLTTYSGTKEVAQNNRLYLLNGKKYNAITFAASPAAGGSVAVVDGSSAAVTSGDSYLGGSEFTITATPNAGYSFSNWTATAGTLANSANASTTFTSPDAQDAALTANFVVNNYTLTLTSANGDVAVTVNGEAWNGSDGIPYGATVEMTSTPASGYAFQNWSTTGVTLDNDASNPVSFTMPAGNVAVTANYLDADINYTITLNQNTGGTISSDKATAKAGETVTLSYVLDTNYRFGEWTVLDGSANDVTVTTNQFTMPASDVEVDASFVLQYTVTCNVAGVTNDVKRDNGATLSLEDPSALNGMAFAGWSTTNDVNSLNIVNNATETVSANRTVYAVFVAKAGTPVYRLVEADQADWRGDYLIAYSDEKFADGRVGGTSGMGANGASVDPSTNLSGKEVDATWGDTYNVTIEAIDDADLTDGYVLKTKDGKYNYQTSNKNGLTSTDNKETAANYPISVTFNSSDDIELGLGGAAAGAIFHYNTGENGFFRFYKDGGQNPVYLYKKMTTTPVYTLGVTESVAISAAKYATFCSTNAVDFSKSGVKVYTAKAEGSVVELTEIEDGIVPANNGVVLYHATAASYNAYITNATGSLENNELVGIIDRTQVDAMSGGKYNYILSNEDEGIGFYAATNGNYLAANKAYLSTTVDPTSLVKAFLGFADGDADAISEIVNGKSVNGTYYDLSGRRVSKATKGIYIVNGKKVVK